MSALCEPSRRARFLFALAVVVTLLSVVLALTASSWFLALTAAVGVSELIFATSGECPASLLMRRACGASETSR